MSIVEMLSAYDDLIENNRRRIALTGGGGSAALPRVVRPLPLPGPRTRQSITNGIPQGWDRLMSLGDDCYNTQYGHTASAKSEGRRRSDDSGS